MYLDPASIVPSAIARLSPATTEGALSVASAGFLCNLPRAHSRRISETASSALTIGTCLAKIRKDQNPEVPGPRPPIWVCRAPAPLAPAPRGRSSVVTYSSDYRGGVIYVRKVKSRGRGPYFQLVRRSYREGGKVRQEVLIHPE